MTAPDEAQTFPDDEETTVRPYPYRFDAEMIRRDLAEGPDGLARIERTFAAGRGQLATLSTAVDDCWGAVAAAWALEESLDVPDLVGRTAGLLRRYRDRWEPGPIPSWNAISFAVTLAMAGDRTTLSGLADVVLRPDGLQTGAGPGPSELALARMLVGLLAGRDEDAAAQPGPPGDDELETPTFAACRAVLDRDQAALEAAAAERSQVRLRLGGRSSRNRATWIYLLDRTAVGIALAAQDRGLRAVEGLPDVPTEIVATRRTS